MYPISEHNALPNFNSAIFNIIPLLESIFEENAYKKRFKFKQMFEYLFMTSAVLDVVVGREE